MHVAYIVKRYPRYSETFIVNEILAHEAAGMKVRIYALLPPQDSHFQDIISRVKAPVSYLSAKAERASVFWDLQKKAARQLPNVWRVLANYPKASAREVTQALELALEIHKHHIQHLHAHFASTSTTVTQIAADVCQIPYSFTAHAKDIFQQDNDFELLKLKFSRSKFAITVSDYNVRYLTQQLGVDSENVFKVYNGLDLACFPFHPYTQREPLILAVGRLVEKKGFKDLIAACRILLDRGTQVRCEIIGSGELKHELQQLIEGYQVQDQVTLLGPMPQQQVKQKLTQAAMFVAPCVVGHDNNKDGLPTVLVESMALGTPCISTDVTGIPEVLDHLATGLMTSQHDPEQLANNIQCLLEDQQLSKEIALNARRHIENHFDIHANTLVLRHLFEQSCIKESL
ncbi:glycosyltransferase [Vibrio sinaloensis]|uniref:glycosyltransferase n=1 Tax=Photobacterium sp. (strain ATCC 43367) TaxID=379097 RepID=UPI0035E96391